MVKLTDPDYPNALESAVRILRERAGKAQLISYGELSQLLAEGGFDSILPHRGVMTYLLRDVCRYENEDGRAPMLSVIVVNKATREPSEQFSVLARQLPFVRSASWTWRDELEAVFNKYRAN